MGRIPPMKMASRLLALILCCLASTVVQSFGELVLLRHRYSENSTNKLTCMSEDQHGAALIWNYDPQSPPKSIEGFAPWRNESGKVDCSVRNATKCLAGWNTTNDWKVENSARKSMGPIFDHRWEVLREFGFEGKDINQEYQEVFMVKRSAGHIWFSARAERGVVIHICKERDPTARGPCIYVVLAIWGGKQSLIKSCPSGLPKPKVTKDNCDTVGDFQKVQQFHATSIEPQSWVSGSTISCLVSSKTPDSIAMMRMLRDKLALNFTYSIHLGTQLFGSMHEANAVMDLYTWRTFRIEWDSDKRKIEVFKNSEPSKPFLTQKYDREWPEEWWVSVRGHASARVRFHHYDYYYTETVNAVITTKQFAHSGKTFRAELMVNLCQECKLKIDVLDGDNYMKTLEPLAEKRSFDRNRLSWQLVTLTTTLNDGGPRDLRFKIQSILDGDKDTGRWAIDTFRIYESGDKKTRRSDVTLKEETQKIICQKLSYAEPNETFVDSNFWIFYSDQAKSQLQKFIREHKEQDTGKYGFMCNRNGCTCGKGFTGFHCKDECSAGSYGYDCAQRCGSCQDLEKCDKKTGFCQGKCRLNYTIAPFCQKDLEAPTFENVGNGTVTVIQEIDLDADLVESVEVYLEEQPPKGNGRTKFSSVKRKSPGNASIFESQITGLKLGTVYEAYTVVFATLGDQSPTDSPRKKFATTCKGRTKFEVVPAEKSLTVRSWNEDCPVEAYGNKGYEVIVTSTSTNRNVGDPVSFGSVPYEMSGLKPATNYTVKIRDNKANYEWDLPDIRTLESAPSKVVGLNASSTNTTVTIWWNPPSDPGGDIRYYGVTIMLRYRNGCKDFDEETPYKAAIELNVTETTKTFEDLDPYATYLVNVTAYNSKKGTSEGMWIDTKPNALPASKVRNLRFNETTNSIQWDYPNCTTVTGSARVHLILMKRKGAPEWDEEWSRRREAKLDYDPREFGLDPFEEYTVRVYVVRSFTNLTTNESAYAEIDFRSNPAAPPAVRNLTIYDADLVSNTVSLRWMPPEPANGDLQGYVISVKDKDRPNFSRTTVDGSEDTDCNFQGGFRCFENLRLPPVAENNELRVEVFAQNKDVEESGNSTALPISQKIFDSAPSSPDGLNVSASQTPGGVTLKWRRPWDSPTRILSYSIRVTFVWTDLLEDKVPHEQSSRMFDVKDPYQILCSTELSLFPSTVYNISIKAISGIRSSEVSYSSFRVKSSVGFGGRLELSQESQFSIEVKVPRIINATNNTWASITAQGMRTCENDHSQTQPPDVPWGAMVFQVNNSGERIFSISGNSYSNGSSNCSLRLGEIYTITLHVDERTTDFGSSKQILSNITLVNESPQESNLVWLVIIPILGILVPVLFIWNRKLRKRGKQRNVPSFLEMLPTSSTNDSNDVSASTDSLFHSEGPNDRQTPEKVCAVANNPDSCSVSLESFEKYTKNGARSGLLNSQFMMLPVGLTRACESGSLPENIRKNRYENLIAYDHSRVVLKKINEDPYSDYINASYIQGYQDDRVYIATQGPMANTVNDFWRMIWQEDVRVICMLTNVVEDSMTLCEQYWPETMTRSKYGDILVYNIDERILADYTFRTFKLSTKLDTRKVMHLHYTGWPSLGLPMYPSSLIAYLKRLRDIPARYGPVIVHCHNGDDRTGTIILADICMRQATAEGMIDAVAAITRMRDDRANMVGTPQQYLLAHILIMESLAQQPTRILCTKQLTSRIKKMKMQLSSDIQRLEDTMWQERALRSLATVNPVTAQDLAEPSPTMDDSENPIGAVSVDGVRVKGQYLASWLPPPLSLHQFWRFVIEKNTKLIIILQCSDPKDPSCCDIISDEPTLLNMPCMEVQSEFNPNGDDHFKTDRILLTEASEDNARLRSITVLTCRGWGASQNGKPPRTETLVSLWEAAEKIPRKEGETLVLCDDGVTGCGLYLALSFLLERMAVDRECDVFAAVRAVRRSRPQFVKTPEEFEYLYDAAVTYAECFAIYSNFT